MKGDVSVKNGRASLIKIDKKGCNIMPWDQPRSA